MKTEVKDDNSGHQADDDRQPGEPLRSAFHAQKQKAVIAAGQHVDPKADAREAFGFMPMSMKGAAIRWRGL